jgi:TrmH family RNA methyltransferase
MMITSTKNETVKLLRSLKDRGNRRDLGLHLIEGERLVFDALLSGVVPDTVLVESGAERLEQRLEDMGVAFISASRSVLEAVSDTKNPQGIAAAVKTPDTAPPPTYPENALIVALDRLQDPGNLGTVLRSADAMGARAVILGEGCTDPFSPKALRSAMGSAYHIPVYEGELKAELLKLKSAGNTLICGHLHGSETLPKISGGCVLVIGNEGSGVSDDIAEVCTLYRLKMRGRAESLNASAAASIMMYELSRLMNG